MIVVKKTRDVRPVCFQDYDELLLQLVHHMLEEDRRQLICHILASQGGSSTIVPLADQPVETWICQFIPCKLCIFAESFVLSPT